MIYLDHNATSPLHPEVLNRLPEKLKFFGNPSSIHWASREPKSILRQTRISLALALGVSPLELVFTSGASEGNSTVIRGVAELNQPGRDEFITTRIEHPSVSQSFEYLESKGFKVHRIGVNRQGEFDFDHFQSVLGGRTKLVSVMAANNETGLVLPISKIASMAKAAGAWVHTDAVQALGKMHINLHEWNVDFATFSGHKIYALKGAGLLYQRKSAEIGPLVFGGGQERHRRGGTENVLGIFSLGCVAPELQNLEPHLLHMKNLRDYFEIRVSRELEDVLINHQAANRLPNTSSLLLKNVNGETLLMSLDLKGIAVSTGAACSSGSPEPSPVLRAMGMSYDEAQTSLRVSVGWFSKLEEIDLFVEELKKSVSRIRSIAMEGAHASL